MDEVFFVRYAALTFFKITNDSYQASCTAAESGNSLASFDSLYYDAKALIRKLQIVSRLTSSIVFICLLELQSSSLMIVCFTCHFFKFGLDVVLLNILFLSDFLWLKKLPYTFVFIL